MAWELCNGPIPEGMTLDHRCTSTLCVNPSHLNVVTLEENIARRGDTRPYKYREGRLPRAPRKGGPHDLR